MTELFSLSAASVHYARSNRLVAADGAELASIVEILRPV
jgi:hypothetical protein